MAATPHKSLARTYTKGAVKRAGIRLKASYVKNPKITDDLIDAIIIADFWRQLHMYPLNTFQPLLRQKLKSTGVKGTQVAQRLKRMPTIVGKLFRIVGSLETMQDIAGMRVVFRTESDLRKFEKAMKSSRFKHVHKRTKDYILNPKTDGYRGVHLIYKSYSLSKDAPENVQGLMIELQLRTQFEHYWATAVEAVDMFYGQTLKFGAGAQEWKQFFELASAAFAHEEKLPPPAKLSSFSREKITKKLIEAEKKINAIHKLSAISSFAGKLPLKERNSSKVRFYLLILKRDPKTGKLSFHHMSFEETDELQANIWYKSYEEPKAHIDNPDVVLVRTTGKQLAALYSNYFLDVSEFLKVLNRILDQK